MKTLADHLGVPPLRECDTDPDYFSEEMSDQDFCRGILTSREYRRSILRRIEIDDLPPAVETMIWNRAHGSVKETVEITNKMPRLQDMAFDELEHRVLQLLQHTRQLRMNEASPSSDEEDVGTPSVH